MLALAVKSVLILGAACFVALAIRRRSASVRHQFWTAAFGALLLLPVLSLALPGFRVTFLEKKLEPVLTLVSNVSGSPADSPAERTNPVAGHSTALTGAASPGSRGPSLAFRAGEAVPWIWAIGATWMLVQMGVAYWRILRARRRDSLGIEQAQRDSLESESNELGEFLGIQKPVEIAILPSREMPASFGRTLFLPVDVTGWDAERRRSVLLHELAHVRRNDTAVKVMARLGLSLFWWNPLAWRAWRGLIETMERAADDAVLRAGVGAPDYAAQLVEVARLMGAGTAGLAPVAVSMARISELEGRLMAILESGRERNVPGRKFALCVWIAAVCLVTPVAVTQAQQPPPVAADLPSDLDAAIRNADSAEALMKLAVRASDLSLHDAALKLMDGALERYRKESGATSIEYGKALIRKGDLQRRAGDPNAAGTYAMALVPLDNKAEGAPALIQMGVSLASAKAYDAALPMFEKAAILDSRQASRASLWTAVVLDRQGKDADSAYQRALSLSEPDSDEAATILEVQAQSLRARGQTEQSASLRAQAGVIRKSRGQDAAKLRTSSGSKRVGQGVTSPKLVSKVEPAYTDEARVARYEGKVVVSMDVGTDGIARNFQVLSGLGFGLSEKAIDALRQWRFEPGTQEGVPVQVLATVEVNFRLL